MITVMLIWLAIGAWAMRIFSNAVGFKEATRSLYDKCMFVLCILSGPVAFIFVLVFGFGLGVLDRDDLFS